MDSSLVEALSHAGLNTQQAATYVALLELGPAPASKVAQKTKINRSVTYQLLNELMQQGYVSKQSNTKVRQFIALNPQGIYESARAHFENLRFLLPLLRTLHASSSTDTTMQIVEGKEAVSRLFQAHDDVAERCFVSSFSDMERIFPEEFKRWSRRTRELKRPTPTKLLLIDDKVGRAYAKTLQHLPSQEFRFFPLGTDFKMDVSILHDRLILVSFQPVCAVVVHSTLVADSAKSLFQLLWKQAKR